MWIGWLHQLLNKCNGCELSRREILPILLHGVFDGLGGPLVTSGRWWGTGCLTSEGAQNSTAMHNSKWCFAYRTASMWKGCRIENAFMPGTGLPRRELCRPRLGALYESLCMFTMAACQQGWIGGKRAVQTSFRIGLGHSRRPYAKSILIAHVARNVGWLTSA